jgi:hypothetical protein
LALCQSFHTYRPQIYLQSQLRILLSFLFCLFTTCFGPYGPSSGWSWSSSCGRKSVDQFVWVSGLLLGPLTRFYPTLLFSSDNYFILLSRASSLTRVKYNIIYILKVLLSIPQRIHCFTIVHSCGVSLLLSIYNSHNGNGNGNCCISPEDARRGRNML